MEINNGRVQHTQGESFTLDMFVRYPNGDPYILSSRSEHPFILFTVASTQYDQNGRYIMRHWLDTKNEDGTDKFPRFFQTTPNEELMSDSSIYDADTFYNWLTRQGDDIWDKETGYTLEVYHLNNNTYWYGKAIFEGDSLSQVEGAYQYEMRIVISFSHEETSNMLAQKYVYFIEGVDGVDLNDWLLQECYDRRESIIKYYPAVTITEENGKITVTETTGGFTEDLSNDIHKLYTMLYSVNPKYVEDISVDQPIVITEGSYNDVIVNDGEWKVVTNINGRGLNKWQTL